MVLRSGPPRPFHRVRLLLQRRLQPASVLDLACESHADVPLFFLDAPLPYRSLSRLALCPRELQSFVNRLGNTLIARGVRAGDRVAIYKTNGPDYFFLGLALWKLGAVAVPVNGAMSLEALAHHLEATSTRVLITDATTFRERIGVPEALPSVTTFVFPDVPPGFSAPCVDLNRELEQASATLAPARLPGESPILIAHTSGTTGFPKGVVTTAAAFTRGVKGHYVDEPVSRHNRTAVAAHFNHLVYFSGLASSLLAAMPVWTLSRHDPEHVLGTLERERIQFFFAFPDVYLRMYAHGLERHELAHMRVWVTTADASHEAHMRAFCKKGAFLRVLGVPLMRSLFLECLGTSEIGFLALRRLRFASSPLRLDRCIGWPSLGGPEVKIADPAGRPLPRGQIGRLMVRGPTLFRGYWRTPEGAPEIGRDGWWWTGDVGYRDRWGRFYHLDRESDVIQTSGARSFSLLIEEVLLTHPDIYEAVVIGVPVGGRQVPFGLVNVRSGRALEPESCLKWANERLPSSSRLHEVIVVQPDEVPRGLTGKVLKRVLRQRYETRFSRAPTTVEPAR